MSLSKQMQNTFRTLISKEKKSLTVSFISTLIFFIAAHGACFSSRIYAGDYLNQIIKNDAAWQIALGRVFQPILELLRGTVSSPWLIGCLMLFWTFLSVYMTAKIFKTDDVTVICLISGIETCNIVYTASNATFLPWSDYYAFSLFLSIAAAFLSTQKEWWKKISALVMVTAVFGIYQAYVFVYITIVAMKMCLDISEKKDIRKTLKETGISAGCFIVAGVLYFICWKILQKKLGIWTSDSYNGLAGLGDYEGYSFASLITKAYGQFFSFFFEPQTFVTIVFHERSFSFVWEWILRIINAAVFISIPAGMFFINRKNKVSKITYIIQASVLMVLPLLINGICILSKGMVHTLMIYPYMFIYVLSIVFMARTGIKRTVPLIAFATVIWCSIVISNQVYMKRNLQEEAAQSLMTRVVERIEETEGYKAGETPVAFAGSFVLSPHTKQIEGFDAIENIYGVGNLSFTYPGLEKSYLKYVMNEDMNITEADTGNEVIKNMPVFPEEGSVAFNEGTLIVKISDIP